MLIADITSITIPSYLYAYITMLIADITSITIPSDLLCLYLLC